MMISTKGRYALRIMVDLAQHAGEELVPLSDAAQRQDISVKYMEAIISTLVKAGFVRGVRGKGGGYCLTKAPREYTVGSILRLMEGTLAPVACLDCQPNACARADRCATLPMWRGLGEVIHTYLESVTLEDLLQQAGPAAGNDYVI